ncbi:DUF4367 domain-containing protein [Anoxybacterium hadale]|uniref:DUF4367 domain-containing protein n=1 Tax=Anoxybacterium hadale TaxID=3408580 RepID=A0ACD1AGI9_9FIRM|nr:DUF4367 domain-containing protein [Clostridiales bacterium]
MTKKYNMDEFQEVDRLLVEADFSDRHLMERTHDRMKFIIEAAPEKNDFTKGDKKYMITSKNNKRKSAAIAAAVFVCLLGGFSATAYGQDIVHNIVAYFQAGNIEITQYDKIPENPAGDGTESSDQKSEEKYTSIESARNDMGIDFAVPTWLPEGFSYTTAIQHGSSAVELQYTNDEEGTFFSLLISQGKNGIDTAGDVKEETIAKQKVYFANGIILWGQDNMNYEIYYTGEKDFDSRTLEQIIGNMTREAVSYDKAPPVVLENGRETAGPARVEQTQ